MYISQFSLLILCNLIDSQFFLSYLCVSSPACYPFHQHTPVMRLSTLIPFIALPLMSNGLPTSQAERTHLLPRAEVAGYIPEGVYFFPSLVANGGCGPNFGMSIKSVIILQGFRCRFYRYIVTVFLWRGMKFQLVWSRLFYVRR
jgi:hypothetical protein